MKQRAGNISRRRFLGASGAAAVVFHVVPSHVLAAKAKKGKKEAEALPPSEKLNLAFVGAGGRANGNIGGCSSQNIYALCDVDKNRCAGSVKKHSSAKSNFDYAGPLTETMLLGCVAARLPSGTKLTWDSEKMRTNNDVANRYLQHEYRKGWSL